MARGFPRIWCIGREMYVVAAIGTLTTLTGAAMPAWSDTGAKTSSHYVEDAKSYLAKGQLRAAEIQLKNALHEDPNDLEARVTLGIVSMREGDAAGAERSFKAALQQSGEQKQILPLLGQAYLTQGKTREILDELKPDSLPPEIAAQIDNLRARAYLLQKSPDEARSEAQAALTLKPEMPEALLTLAALDRQKGDYVAAETHVDRAIKAMPDNTQALDAKGDLRASQGDHRGALDTFSKALALRPDDANAQLGEAAAYLALGQVEQARSDVDQVLSRQPNQPVGLYFRALILERAGKYADALAALNPAASKLDDALPAQILLGELNLRADHVGKAESYAQHALSLAPSSASTQLLLALVYTRENQPLRVIQLLVPAAATSSENAQIEMVLGDAYGRVGRFEDAAKALEIALRQNPSDTDLRTRLDASRIGAGDRDAGMNDLSQLLKTDPQADRAGVLMISSMIGQGRLDEAEKVVIDLRAKQPNNPLIDNLAGRIHVMTGDWKSAEGDFRSALRKRPAFLEAARYLDLLLQIRGAPDQAQALYQSVLQADPKSAPAMAALAMTAEQGGNGDEAITWLEKASAAAPDSTGVRVQLIEMLLRQGKTRNALAMAQALDRAAHDVPEVVNTLARTQLAAGQLDNAMMSFRHLAELNPNSALGQYQLGETLDALNRHQDAIAAFRASADQNPNYLPAWMALISTEAQTDGLDGTTATIEQASTHEAVLPYADALRGEAFLAVKRYADAEDAFRRVLARAPNVHFVTRIAEARVQSGDKAGAADALAEWLKTHPDDVYARGAYATSLMANKDDAAAEREYQALLLTNPVNVSALNNLAWLYSESDPAKASKYAHLAFGLAPQSPQVRDTLAWVLLKLGDTATATNLLRLAHAQVPGDPEISYHLAMTLARAGDKDGARALVTPLAHGNTTFASQDDARQLLQKLGSAE